MDLKATESQIHMEMTGFVLAKSYFFGLLFFSTSILSIMNILDL
jgi:hypothetical protein